MVKIRNGTLGVRSGLHDGAGVVLQDLNPACEIAGMVGARFNRQAKIGGKKSCAKFGNQLLAGITFIAPFLAPE